MDRWLPDQPYPGFSEMMLREGFDTKKVEWTTLSWNIDDLISGKVDALGGYSTTQVPELRKRGIPIRTLNPLDYGVDLYGDTLITSAATAKQSPALLRGFMRATARGWIYAFEHVDEMLTRILSMPTLRPQPLDRELLKIEAHESRRLIEPDLVPIGFSNPLRWERTIDLFRKLDEVPPSFNTEGLFFPDEIQEHQKLTERLGKGLGILVIIAGIAGLWIRQLRRQVRKKTHELQDAILRVQEQKTIAERSNEVKSLFLANMSHEIRTPLTAILGYSELLKSDQVTREERLRFLSIIERTGHSLTTILSDILDLSKIEAEKLEIISSPTSIRAVIDDIEAILRPLAETKGVSLAFSYSADLQECLETDAVRLKQILLNVVGNSLKFTERGGVEVRVSHGHGKLFFTVSDTGIGIGPRESEILFQTFSQIDPTIRRSYGGTGLGLSLARKLARLLGGDVVLEKSAVNQGSTFRIEVPYSPISIPADLSPQNSATSHNRLDGKKILVVDDCTDNQALIRIFLSKAGALVSTANHGGEALDRIKQDHFDLVVMDIQMPIMDGYTATQKIRESGYTGPIVALTANAMKDEVERCYASGCDAYLTKPVKKNELVDALILALRP